MKDRPYLLFLEDILSSIQKIGEYTGGMSFEDFQGDSRTVDEVLKTWRYSVKPCRTFHLKSARDILIYPGGE